MRAACLLVCLSLAHCITGSIFEPQPLEELIAQPLDVINQYQQKNQQQLEESQYHQNVKRPQKVQQKPRRHHYQSEESQYQYPQHSSQQQQSDESQNQYTSQESVYRQKKHRQWQSQESKEKSQEWQQQQQSAESQYRPNNLHWQNQQQQYQDRGQHHHHHTHRGSHHKKSHSGSSSSSSESQEHNQKSNEYYNSVPQTNQKWNALDATVVTYGMGRGFSDIVMLNDQRPVALNHITDKRDIKKIFGDAQKAIRHIKPQDKAKFHETYAVAMQKENEDTQLNATKLAQKHQYPVEEHIIKTDDGYFLTLFRIPPKTQTRNVQKRPVAFLMHGILGSADDWLLMGPGKSLAYLLSDEGYDVWLGNARGNKYSTRHVSMHPAVKSFWQFSIDEVALHDLPAMIDYTLQTTNQEKLYYIGHSLGATAFFALTSTKPEYNDKIVMMHALSPVVYMKYARSPLLRMIAPSSKFHEPLETELGYADFKPNKELVHIVGGVMCEDEVGCKELCSNVNFAMAGVNVEGLNADVIPMIMSHLPAGTSVQLIKHYGQGVALQEFRRYDHGPAINTKVYGTPEPPTYDMQKVRAPVTLHYSDEDWLAHPKDVERLQNELPNVMEAVKVPDQHFNYMDFQFSTKAPEIVYKQLIESMEKQLY